VKRLVFIHHCHGPGKMLQDRKKHCVLRENFDLNPPHTGNSSTEQDGTT